LAQDASSRPNSAGRDRVTFRKSLQKKRCRSELKHTRRRKDNQLGEIPEKWGGKGRRTKKESHKKRKIALAIASELSPNEGTGHTGPNRLGKTREKRASKENDRKKGKGLIRSKPKITQCVLILFKKLLNWGFLGRSPRGGGEHCAEGRKSLHKKKKKNK